jgi:hypothetical protein
MGHYTAYLTPQLDSTGKTGIVITNSKLENSLYCISGSKPGFFDIFSLKEIPKTERGFYNLIRDTFEKRIIILDNDIENFCKKYKFVLEDLRT